MNYQPLPPPTDAGQLSAYIVRELRRIAAAFADSAEVVAYRTRAADAGTLSSAVSANWRIADGNVIRVSCSATLTITGIKGAAPYGRELVLLNDGTAPLVLKHEGTESSASWRFSLPTSTATTLAANGGAIIWYDPKKLRWRQLNKEA